jgi:hypothetical protein
VRRLYKIEGDAATWRLGAARVWEGRRKQRQRPPFSAAFSRSTPGAFVSPPSLHLDWTKKVCEIGASMLFAVVYHVPLGWHYMDHEGP